MHASLIPFILLRALSLHLARIVTFALLAACCPQYCARADVLHWWRYEQNEFLLDTVGNVELSQGSYGQVALPRKSDGAGSSFPSGFEGLGPNYNAFRMHTVRGAPAQNTTPVDGDFTVEMFVHFDSLLDTTFTHFLGGQGTPPATPASWSWGSQVRMDRFAGTEPREFVLLLSDGSAFEYPKSGIVLEENIDYYLASSFDLAEREVTYYVKDLTNNTDLRIVKTPHSLDQLNPDAQIVVGGSNRPCCVPDGIMDEFRFSNHVLAEEELLITNALPPLPRTEIGSVIDSSRQLDGHGDFVTANVGSVGEDQVAITGIHRMVTKFELPKGESSRIKNASLRIFLETVEGVPTGPLSVYHSVLENDFQILPSDYENDSYVDASRFLADPTHRGDAFYEVDVTDLVLADFRADGDDPVTSIRLQVDGASLDVGGGNNAYKVFNGAMRDARNPQLVLTFVPEPSTQICAVIAMCAGVLMHQRPRLRQA